MKAASPIFDAGAAALRIGRVAAEATSLRAFRVAVLDVVREQVPFDAAIFHALSPRVPIETGVVVGIDPEALARSQSRWDDLAVELGTLRDRANEELAVTDEDVFPIGSRSRSRFERHVVRPFSMSSLCMVHLVVRGSVRAAIVLLSRRRRAFDARAVAALRELAPAIAAADLLHVRLDDAPRASSPVRLVCRDERLTARQREIVEHIALGHTNAETAQALGVSANTLRNHLARIFARIGAANRAEVVRLAVLGNG